MSRSFGLTLLTGWPPMRSVPEEMPSSPATIRSAVVLPHPDGPTSTMNSPSATSRSRSLTAWKPFSYTLLTFSRPTVAITPPETDQLTPCVMEASSNIGTPRSHPCQELIPEYYGGEQAMAGCLLQPSGCLLQPSG